MKFNKHKKIRILW